MLWRHLCLVRAWSAAGLVGGLSVAGRVGRDRPGSGPGPRGGPPRAVGAPRRRRDGYRRSAQGRSIGRSDRHRPRPGSGQGPDDPPQYRPRAGSMSSCRRAWSPRARSLRVPAAAAAAGGGGLQSIGLGSVTNRPGAFGEFQGDAGAGGLRSIPATGEPRSRSVAVPAGETVDVDDSRRLPQLRPRGPHAARQV